MKENKEKNVRLTIELPRDLRDNFRIRVFPETMRSAIIGYIKHKLRG
jgi:hypothetical protein